MDLCLKGGGFYTHIYVHKLLTDHVCESLTTVVTRIFTQTNGVFTHYTKCWT
jgi:hypothetical protein